MPIKIKPLNILAFPQHWDGNAMTLRFLCVPSGDPEAALRPGGPSFATADFRFEARLIDSPAHLPRTVDAVAADPQPLLLDEPPVQKAALFAELHNHFTIAVPGPRARPLGTPRFRKPVTESYRALVGDRQLSPGLADADDYLCGLHEAHAGQPAEPAPIDVTRTWGEVIAFALRQPKLATALGLGGQARIVPPPGTFAAGGWLWVTLHASGDLGGEADLAASFAARIPPLDAAARDIYSALLFPIDAEGIDEGFADVTRHDRGFARLVHATTGDDDGDGISLAWDDEFVADDFARQVSGETGRPMATAGFRIDVRDPAAGPAWHSLQKIASPGLKLGPLDIGRYDGEAAVEVVPVQASPLRPGDFWMPPYFCTWRGASLVLTDADLTRLHAGADIDAGFESHRLGRQQVFAAVDDKAVPLLYGHGYEFRVRLADLSRGGPDADAPTPDDPGGEAHHVVAVAFPRRRRPGRPEILERPTREALRIVLGKPRLRHPELLFTGKSDFDTVFDAARADAAAGRQQEFGLPDPDVVALAIRVEVAALTGEAAGWLPLYETSRAFDGKELQLDLAPADVPDFAGLSALQPDAGPLTVPTARALRFVLIAVGRDEPGYFASDAARRGDPVTIEVRATPSIETDLLGPVELKSFLFRVDPAAHPLARLAQEAGLEARSQTLSARPGQRTVFGCSNALKHVLAPDAASLTFASDADVTQRWINAVQFDLRRDWTWDGLAPNGLVVRRTIRRAGQPDVTEIAGTIAVPHALPRRPAGTPADARDPARMSSRMVFIDAIDPKPRPLDPTAAKREPRDAAAEAAQFPAELDVTYTITATLADGVASPDPLAATVLLPIATPPVQVPVLVSAGIALSPYDATADYSATSQRDRMLWLEFAEKPADPQDRYFVRVVALAPDPLLIDRATAALVPEPALAIDSETMRLIVPGQPRDDNGLAAMQPLQHQSPGGVTWLVPLPDGLAANSAELFGMFTYEVRLGHAGPAWSTAQGRFGPPLRIAGVQHPPPPLVCQAARGEDAIKVRAAFATAVHNGRHLRPVFPNTRLWAVLYARVRQADAAGWRNLMLLRLPLPPPPRDPNRPLPEAASAPLLFGETSVSLAEIARLLRSRGLPEATPLSALAVEFLTEPEIDDPLGSGLGHARMLRTSPLVAIPDAC